MHPELDQISIVFFFIFNPRGFFFRSLWYKWWVFHFQHRSPKVVIYRRSNYAWITRICQKWRKTTWKIKRVIFKWLILPFLRRSDYDITIVLKFQKFEYYSYINEYEKIRTEAASDVERYVGNPLNSYLLIKRLTSDWKEVRELVSEKVRFVYLQIVISDEF